MAVCYGGHYYRVHYWRPIYYGSWKFLYRNYISDIIFCWGIMQTKEITIRINGKTCQVKEYDVEEIDRFIAWAVILVIAVLVLLAMAQ